MRESIFYSAIKSLFVAFCAVLGIGLGFVFFSVLIAALSSSANVDTKLKTVNVEEIMPNVDGERKALSAHAPVILQLDIDGIIGTEELNMQTVKLKLIESREEGVKNNRVKAILVNINTPGGTVIDADGIYRALKEYKAKYKVPIYTYVDGLCASGGIYVASATDKIYASEVSLIGSVGVIAPTFMNFTKLLDKVGVETLTISAGKDKDAMNPLRPWKPGEEKNYENIIHNFYERFIHIVSESRPGLTKEKLVKEYGAGIFSAKDALAYGFIDGIDESIGEAIKKLAKEAGIEGEYQIIKLENKNWLSSLFSGSNALSNALLTGKVKHELMLDSELPTALQGKFLYLHRP
jgi:protease-4